MSETIQNDQDVEAYSPVLIGLLQGVIYGEDKLWERLLQYRTVIQRYFAKIGLEPVIFEGDGFAYLKQKEGQDRETSNTKSLPRLIRRVPLTYEVTLLSVLLRERLHQFDSEGSDSTRLILTKEEIREMVVLFFKEKANEVKLLKNIDAVIHKVTELGFLRKLKISTREEYEVMRILKAKFAIEALEQLKEKLVGYGGEKDESNDDSV
ncbi:hypothetical protein MNBD_UNCLBAC01-1858 [hydrothermal vent metagenome]|uniref:DUF4194 domain-containing protein n=1 Tax=hydrothermal vent metagenome TaxID=652676 RepID=A0A3B1DLN7_9ZZZZ